MRQILQTLNFIANRDHLENPCCLNSITPFILHQNIEGSLPLLAPHFIEKIKEYFRTTLQIAQISIFKTLCYYEFPHKKMD
jgi:hypothetical protein